MNENEKGVVVLILLWGIFGLFIGGWLFEYSFEYWASYFRGQPFDLPFLIAMVGGALLSGVTVPIAFVTFTCSLFM